MATLNKSLCSLIVAAGAVGAFAGSPALDWTSTGTNGTGVTSTRGFSFDVTAAGGINVTALTFFDNGADGLADSHAVGIWDSAGNLLVSGTISAGTVDPLDVNGLFRVLSISSFHLAPGTNYVVGGVFLAGSTDLQAINMVGLTTPAGITYDQTRFNNNGVNALSFPTSTISSVGLPGGSFEFTAAPEPASIMALGLGFLALARRRRK